MDKRRHRTLILDTDPETLLTLQYVLEDEGIDATITWDVAEARQLLANALFDLILIGEQPPELSAAAIIDDLSMRGICPPVLIFGGIFGEKDTECFRRLGAIGVVPKRDPHAVLEEVTRALATMQLKAEAATADFAGSRSLRAAS